MHHAVHFQNSPGHAYTAGAATPLNRPTPITEHQKLETQARKWVAQTFFGTLLKQVRESPFRSKLFDGGRGGEAFGSLYDQQMADHMARGAGSKLVNEIVRRIEANKAYKGAGRIPAARSTRVPSPAQIRSAYATPTLRA